MFNLKFFLFFCCIFYSTIIIVRAQQDNDSDLAPPDIDVGAEDQLLGNSIDDYNTKVSENRVAAQLLAIIEHYKQADPVGIPGAKIPDPLDVPDVKKSFTLATLNLMNTKAYGLSKFRISHIKADIKAMEVEASIHLDEMIARGNYTFGSLFSSAKGPFSIKMLNLLAKCTASLVVERSGELTTDTIRMDITFGNMITDFQNLGFLGSVFQSVVNSAPNLVFDTMKPFMLQEFDRKARAEINTNIEKLMGDRRLPNSITPIDMALSEGRKRIRAMGYDPYRLPDYNRTVGVFSIQLSNTYITGISSFYRVGDMIVSMENNTVALRFHIGTQLISGASQWEVGLGLITRIGHVQFTVQHIRATVGVSQALDTRKRPQINDLQIDLGNIQVRCDGAGTLDYIMEFVVNVLPNLLRYQIMDALENPIKTRIQAEFNRINVEQAIKENLDKFQTLGKEFPFDFKI